MHIKENNFETTLVRSSSECPISSSQLLILMHCHWTKTQFDIALVSFCFFFTIRFKCLSWRAKNEYGSSIMFILFVTKQSNKLCVSYRHEKHFITWFWSLLIFIFIFLCILLFVWPHFIFMFRHYYLLHI